MWAATGEPRCRLLQVNPKLVCDGSDPGKDIAKLMDLVFGRSLSDCLGQLADLLHQPGDGHRHAPLGIGSAVLLAHQILKLGEVHLRLVARGIMCVLNSMPWTTGIWSLVMS